MKTKGQPGLSFYEKDLFLGSFPENLAFFGFLRKNDFRFRLKTQAAQASPLGFNRLRELLLLLRAAFSAGSN
jgi:hypothetical protein